MKAPKPTTDALLRHLIVSLAKPAQRAPAAPSRDAALERAIAALNKRIAGLQRTVKKLEEVRARRR